MPGLFERCVAQSKTARAAEYSPADESTTQNVIRNEKFSLYMQNMSVDEICQMFHTICTVFLNAILRLNNWLKS